MENFTLLTETEYFHFSLNEAGFFFASKLSAVVCEKGTCTFSLCNFILCT